MSAVERPRPDVLRSGASFLLPSSKKTVLGATAMRWWAISRILHTEPVQEIAICQTLLEGSAGATSVPIKGVRLQTPWSILGVRSRNTGT
jgi:hypothetical protein